MDNERINLKYTATLIDGDVLAYQAAARAETSQVDFLTFQDQLLTETQMWHEKSKGQKLKICLSEGRSFRYKVFPDYKKKRQDISKPAYYADAIEILKENFDIYSREGLEGDDMLGVVATNPKFKDSVIVSIDKDLLQIPGLHWNPRTSEWQHVDPDTGMWFFHMQWLTGDSTDGYSGLPGIGPVKAKKFLQPFCANEDPLVESGYNWKEAERAIIGWYMEKEYGIDYIIQQARCAYILQFKDWVKEQNTFRMWDSDLLVG